MNKIFEEISDSLFKKIKDRYIKEKVDYFEIFLKGISISLEAAKSLKNALTKGTIDYNELLHVKEMKLSANIHVSKSLRVVEDAFITPIDQRDIIEILKGIENIIHSIESIANHLYIMKVSNKDNVMERFAEIIITSCEKLYELMVAFKDSQKHTNRNIAVLIAEIDKLEDEGDHIYSESIFNLFQSEKDTLVIIKKMEIYKRLEHSLDCFEHVADIVGNLIAAKM